MQELLRIESCELYRVKSCEKLQSARANPADFQGGGGENTRADACTDTRTRAHKHARAHTHTHTGATHREVSLACSVRVMKDTIELNS